MAKKKIMLPSPKNMQEFMDFGWDKHIILRIKAFSLADPLNKEDELLQDVLLALIETNYIERFDEAKGSFITYLYGFVDNLLKKKFNKENTRYGRFIVNRASFEISPGTDVELDRSKVYLDMLVDPKYESSSSPADTELLIESIREILTKNRETALVPGKKGDSLTVFEYLLQDYSILEISKKMGTSRQFVYWLCKRMRKILQEEGLSVEDI